MGLLGIVLCAGFGAVIVWRGGGDIASGDFAAICLLGLCASGVIASAGLMVDTPHAERLYRTGRFVRNTSLAVFFACLVVFGLIAPALVVSPGSGKAPDTIGEARMLALWTVVVGVAVTVSTVVDRRRARKAQKTSSQQRRAS